MSVNIMAASSRRSVLALIYQSPFSSATRRTSAPNEDSAKTAHISGKVSNRFVHQGLFPTTPKCFRDLPDHGKLGPYRIGLRIPAVRNSLTHRALCEPHSFYRKSHRHNRGRQVHKERSQRLP